MIGFIILILQSQIGFDFIKASIAYIIYEIIQYSFVRTAVETVIIRIFIFTVLSLLVNRFQDSVIRWALVMLSSLLFFIAF